MTLLCHKTRTQKTFYYMPVNSVNGSSLTQFPCDVNFFNGRINLILVIE